MLRATVSANSERLLALRGKRGVLYAMTRLHETEANIDHMLSQCEEVKMASVAMEVGIN